MPLFDSQSTLRQQKALLLYLEHNGHIEELLRVGRSYFEALKLLREKGSVGQPLSLKIELDIALVTNISGELGALICQEPTQAEILVEQLLVCIFQETAIEYLPGDFGVEQLHVPLRVSCVPRINLLEHHTKRGINGLVVVRGILTAFTTSAKYTRSCVAMCPIPLCPGSAKRRVRGAWVRGRRCCLCSVEKLEVAAEREVGEEMLALMWPSQPTGNAKESPVTLIFRDELREGLVLGVSYEIVCQPVVHSRIPCCLLACSRPHLLQKGALIRACQLGRYTVPPMLHQLKSEIGHSPWAFVWTIASQIGHDVVPENTFLQLRLAVLLSLASQGSSYPVPLLVYGGEHTLVSRLLLSAASLASHYIIHGPQDVVGGCVRKAEEMEGSCWAEAGSVLLATNGVCMLGDWAALKKEAKNTTLACIESGKVMMQVPGQSVNFPLKSAIWTHCSRMPLKLLRPLIDVFGLPWLAETSDIENSQLCDWLLNKSAGSKCQGEENINIPVCEIQELISVVGMREEQISGKAGHLIKSYFVASRRARASGGAGVEECLPIGAIQTMTNLAEAHARLSLRSTVEVPDAVAVISLYEQSLVKLFGPAFMAPPPPLTCANLQVPLHCQVDDYLSQFYDWLQNYIQALLGDNEE